MDTSPSAPTPGYDAQLLLTEPYVAVLPLGHPLADRDTIALRELRAERWVDNDVARGPCRQTVLDACAAAGFAPTFQIEAPDYPSALALVGAGMGITVLPRLAASLPGPGLRAVPVIEPMPIRRAHPGGNPKPRLTAGLVIISTRHKPPRRPACGSRRSGTCPGF